MIRIYDKNQFHEISAETYSSLILKYPPASFSLENLLKDKPDAHIIYTNEGRADAWCSVWWEGTPESCGTVGHLFADSDNAGLEVLRIAEMLLESQNCNTILAPMNGNTWRSYRYATGGSGESSFLMEPPAAAGREQILHGAGFAPCNQYLSYVTPLVKHTEEIEAVGEAGKNGEIGFAADEADTGDRFPLQRLRDHGITVSTLDMEQFESSLAQVYILSLKAFSLNPFYTDLPKDAFLSQYVPYRRLLIPELILMAWYGDRLVGFLFCIPDYAEGSKPTTLLFKTIAVHPDCQNLGIAGALVDTAKKRAADLGFTRAIGALIHETNHSGGFFRNAEVFRKYTLYSKELNCGKGKCGFGDQGTEDTKNPNHL